MAIARVQGNARGVTPTATLVVTMDSTPTSGNLLIACIGTDEGLTPYVTVSSITQTGVNWATGGAGKQVQSQNINSYLNSEIWVGIVGAGASTTITIALSDPPNNGAVADVCEYSGLVTSAFLDKTATATGTSTATSTGTTATTTQNDELWIGSIAVYFWAQSTPTNGFTLFDGAKYSQGNGMSEAYLEKIVSATGTANSGTTCSNAYYAGCIATFFATIAGGPTVKKGSNVATTMTEMLNSKMLFSACNRFPKLTSRSF